MMPPPQQPKLEISNQITNVTSIEDTLDGPVMYMIKTVHECYQRHLSPMVLLKKNFSASNSKFNSAVNTFDSNRLAIGYNNVNDVYEDYGSGENFYKNLYEIAEHFQFYAVNLGNFLSEISGKKLLGESFSFIQRFINFYF